MHRCMSMFMFNSMWYYYLLWRYLFLASPGKPTNRFRENHQIPVSQHGMTVPTLIWHWSSMPWWILLLLMWHCWSWPLFTQCSMPPTLHVWTIYVRLPINNYPALIYQKKNIWVYYTMVYCEFWWILLVMPQECKENSQATVWGLQWYSNILKLLWMVSGPKKRKKTCVNS